METWAPQRTTARQPPGLVLITCAVFALTALQASASAATEEAPPANTLLEEVLVTGQQPGPGLWRVTGSGDATGHVLWILGSHSPLPKKLQWRSSELEAVLATSQEVVAPPSVNADVGVIGGFAMLPSLIGARRNPGDRRLEDVLPPDLYARWLPLKARYLGKDDDVEEWRPLFAAQELYQAALEKHGLVPYEGVWPEVKKLARKQGVPVTKPVVEFKFDKARSAVKEFKSMELSDVDCFARTIQRLEQDMELMRDRANAWAVGDVSRLQRLAPVERASACIGIILDSSLMRERGLADVPERVRSAWMAAAQQSLAHNATTVAVLSIDELLRPNGYLARLRELGYVVEDP